MSYLEELLDDRLLKSGFPIPEREYIFHPTRKWRFDFAYPKYKIAVEIEGGTRSKYKSRHTTATGFQSDCEKYNEAAILGWIVLRVTTSDVKTNKALDYLDRLLRVKENEEKQRLLNR